MMHRNTEIIILEQLNFLFRGGNKKEKKAAKKGLERYMYGIKISNPCVMADGYKKIGDAYEAMRLRISGREVEDAS